MKKILISVLLSIVAVISFVSAYPVTMQLNSNTQFNTSVYSCTDSSCSSGLAFYASDFGNPDVYVINNTGAGVKYFAEYDFVHDRCFVSHSYTNSFDESTSNGPFTFDVIFTKQANCESIINAITHENTILDNETQDVTVNVKSPFNLNPQGPQAVPQELNNFYSTNVSVKVKVKNGSIVVAEQLQSSDILWSTTKQFSFSFSGLTAGNYILEIITDVNDCMCSSSLQNSESKNFTVLASSQPQPPQNVTNIAPVANFTFSPTQPNITQIVNFDASSSFDPDGSIISYLWDFGDATTASGVTTTHSYSATGNYSVKLTVVDSNNTNASIIKTVEVVNITAQQPPDGGGEGPAPSTKKKVTKEGDVENIIVRTFLLENKECGKQSDLTIELYNEDTGRISDVMATFEIKELNIKEETDFFNLDGRDSKWLFLSVNWPNAQGAYYAKIRLNSRNEVKDIIQKIDISCPIATAFVSTTTGSEPSQTSQSGITGNVIANLASNASVLGLLFAFIVIALIALIIKLIMLRA